MSDALEIAAIIRSIIQTTWPGRFTPDQLAADVPLGEGGIGLESVEIAELLLAAEDACDIDDESLFELSPLTITRISHHLALVAT